MHEVVTGQNMTYTLICHNLKVGIKVLKRCGCLLYKTCSVFPSNRVRFFVVVVVPYILG